MGNAQGNAANIIAPPGAISVASKMAPPSHPADDDDADYAAIADMAWAHVNDENQPPGAHNLGGNGKPVRGQSSGRGSYAVASPAPALRSTPAPASAKLKRDNQQAREEEDGLSSSKRRRMDGQENQACNDESRVEHQEDVEEDDEDEEDENEDDSMIATMAWEALRSGSPTASVASSAWSGECKACRGHHRPHTCGKPKPASAKEECKACKGRKRAHTCGLEAEIAQRREQCKACRGKKRAHTCGKGTGETLEKESAGKKSVSGGGKKHKTIKKGSVGKQASAAAAASNANAAKPKASKDKKKSGNKGRKNNGVDGDDAKAAEAALRVMMQEEEEEEEKVFSKTGRVLKKSIKGKEAKRNAAANQSESESSGSESESGDDEDDGDEGHDDDAGASWSPGMIKLLMKAYGRVRPDSSDFWGDVASGVPGKTAQDCCDRYHAKFPTPGAIKGKSKLGRRRPQSPLGGAGFKKAAATTGDGAEGGAGDGDRAAGEEGEGEGDAGLEAAMLLAKKGTNARRKEFRHVMSKADVDHADDVFEGSSCPVSGTPFRGSDMLARLMSSRSFVGAPSPVSVAGHRTPASGRGKTRARVSCSGLSPGILNTPGLEGRDKLDNYIDNTKKRARARVPYQAPQQAQKPPKTPTQKAGSGITREVRALKRLIARGEGTRVDGGGGVEGMEEEEEDMDMDEDEVEYDEDGDVLASPI